MSSQKGNLNRQRPQKHKNIKAFKNTVHDLNYKKNVVEKVKLESLCTHCKGVIEWKIKYKQYKPLTQPKTCVKCSQKSVKSAYHDICANCAENNNCCAKCFSKITQIENTIQEIELTEEMQTLVKSLPERKRRTFHRYLERKKQQSKKNTISNEEILKKISIKLNTLAESNETDIKNDANKSDSFDSDDLSK